MFSSRYFPGRYFARRYFPALGGEDNPIPVIVPIGSVIFTFNSNTLILPAPDFGNQHTYEKTRIFRQTRGLTDIIYADDNWPKREALFMKFSKVSKETKDAFLDFLEESLGKLINFTDYESRDWIGMMVDPNSPAIDEGRNCSWTIQFTFKGILV